MNNTNFENKFAAKPELFINKISFNDDTSLELLHNSIVVFTGANNSGKSQVLKDIDYWFERKRVCPKVIVNIDYEFSGDIEDEPFFSKNFYKDLNGNFVMYGSRGNAYDKSIIEMHWAQKDLSGELRKLFIKLINTEQRLTTSNAIERNNRPGSHSIFKVYNSNELFQIVSTYFKQAFNTDLVINRNEITDIPLHVGKAPDVSKYTMAQQEDYYNEVTKLERLEWQGDGMRSFASILLDTFTSEYTITLIDEPEAFLHPPQVRLLGKMLAQNNPTERQLFISTHSEDFLQGLIDANSENVTIIHINRKDNINHMSVLQNSDIKKLWSNPILRYSNILSGLFHEKVVVCESDYDCLFYQAVMNAICEEKNKIAPSVLFTHCGGKGRMKDIVRALHALKVPVIAIPDFDIINNSGEFKPLAEAFDITWSELPTKDVYDWLNANHSIKDNIKRQGKSALDGTASIAYAEIEKTCHLAGLFIVPCGEMECFHKNTLSKADWVFNELEKSNLASDSELSGARAFVQSIMDFSCDYLR